VARRTRTTPARDDGRSPTFRSRHRNLRRCSSHPSIRERVHLDSAGPISGCGANAVSRVTHGRRGRFKDARWWGRSLRGTFAAHFQECHERLPWLPLTDSAWSNFQTPNGLSAIVGALIPTVTVQGSGRNVQFIRNRQQKSGQHEYT